MKTIYVYENWLSDTPSLIGRLYVDTGKDIPLNMIKSGFQILLQLRLIRT